MDESSGQFHWLELEEAPLLPLTSCEGPSSEAPLCPAFSESGASCFATGLQHFQALAQDAPFYPPDWLASSAFSDLDDYYDKSTHDSGSTFNSDLPISDSSVPLEFDTAFLNSFPDFTYADTSFRTNIQSQYEIQEMSLSVLYSDETTKTSSVEIDPSPSPSIENHQCLTCHRVYQKRWKLKYV